MSQFYKITMEAGRIFYAEVPEGKKLTYLDKQIEVWFENIEGGKYRKKGIEAEVIKQKDVPATGVNWLSCYPSYLETKPVKKQKNGPVAQLD